MKYLVATWAAPLVLFWGWYFLSLNDINFGTVYLTRQLHDIVFQIYGEQIGMDPAQIPILIAEVCLMDTAIVAGLWALRRHREIAAWARERYQRYFPAEPKLEASPEEPRF